ncbi:relaxase/mobilization nuclease domain-containing protein (plasmid) [Oscillospiraceae bacterium PP1C4]
MAVTKIHPIKSTLKKSLDYICNPEKTDEKILISSFGCTPETADIEFDFTRKLAKNKSTVVLARHLIQSFEPGEVTPEKAHEIGKQFADEVLGGKYEYILSTHIDKGHVHNHIIFNNVDLIDHKRYDSNKKSYHELRRSSDRLCKENGLSVIKNPVAKNISRKEYEERKKGTSWKSQLQTAIENSIKYSKTFDNFLEQMKDSGYEIKQGKYIAFRAKGQERFTRAKTLGEAYSEEAIRKRIRENSQQKKRNTIYRPNVLRVNLLINIKAHAAAKVRAYDRWAKVRNLKETANTLNFLTAQNITSWAQLNDRFNQLEKDFKATGETIKSAESKLRDMSETISNLTKVQKLKPITEQYKKAFNKKRFYSEHESELIIYAAAEKALSDIGLSTDQNIEQVSKEYSQLLVNKNALYNQFKAFRIELNNFKNAHSNIKKLMQPIKDKRVIKEKER